MDSERQAGRLAEILVRHSVKAKRGEIVRITGNELSRPLALAVYREVLRAGAHPLPAIGFEEGRSLVLQDPAAAGKPRLRRERAAVAIRTASDP